MFETSEHSTPKTKDTAYRTCAQTKDKNAHFFIHAYSTIFSVQSKYKACVAEWQGADQTKGGQVIAVVVPDS